jgi:hypothetical protein
MKLHHLIVLLFIVQGQSFGQIELSKLEGSWFISQVNNVVGSPTIMSREELQYTLETMQEGYLQIGYNTIDFIQFDGDFELNIQQGMRYVYNQANKTLEVRDKTSDEKIEIQFMLIEASESTLIYQYKDSSYILDYHFSRAKPEQLIIGSWGFSSLSMADYIDSLPPNDKAKINNSEELFQEEYSVFFIELSHDSSGYLEVPRGDGLVNASNFSWIFAPGYLLLKYDNEFSHKLKVISIKHNELILEIVVNEFTIALTLTRL